MAQFTDKDRTKLVNAEQWDGSNLAAILAYRAHLALADGALSIWQAKSSGEGWHPIVAGEWLVEDGGQYAVLADADFRAAFDEGDLIPVEP